MPRLLLLDLEHGPNTELLIHGLDQVLGRDFQEWPTHQALRSKWVMTERPLWDLEQALNQDWDHVVALTSMHTMSTRLNQRPVTWFPNLERIGLAQQPCLAPTSFEGRSRDFALIDAQMEVSDLTTLGRSFLVRINDSALDLDLIYQAAAQGCLPLFTRLRTEPTKATGHWPRDLFQRARTLYLAGWEPRQIWAELIWPFHNWSRTEATTANMARRFLQELGTDA